MTNARGRNSCRCADLAWDAEALSIFGIPAAILPEIRPSSFLFGETVPVGPLPGGLPIASLIGDSHASLYGLGGFRPGSVKATYGTGSSLMTPTSAPIFFGKGLSTTVAWARERPVYALEGNIYATGAGVQWVGELLRLADPGPEVEKLAHSVEDTAGVYFVPALTGLGAPHWSESARGVIAGLTRGRAQGIWPGPVEAIAFQVRDVFDAMQAEAHEPLSTLLADGGASRSDLLMQFQADMLGCPVLRSTSPDVSPLGAAFLAGLAVGIWTDEAEIERLVPPRDRFEPRMPADQRETLYAGWRERSRARYCAAADQHETTLTDDTDDTEPFSVRSVSIREQRNSA